MNFHTKKVVSICRQRTVYRDGVSGECSSSRGSGAQIHAAYRAVTAGCRAGMPCLSATMPQTVGPHASTSSRPATGPWWCSRTPPSKSAARILTQQAFSLVGPDIPSLSSSSSQIFPVLVHSSKFLLPHANRNHCMTRGLSRMGNTQQFDGPTCILGDRPVKAPCNSRLTSVALVSGLYFSSSFLSFSCQDVSIGSSHSPALCACTPDLCGTYAVPAHLAFQHVMYIYTFKCPVKASHA